MQTRKPPQTPVENWESIRDEWVESVDELVSEVERWVRKRQWLAYRNIKSMTEDSIGSYDVPMLIIHTPNAPMILDPIARYVVGALGRVDLCVFSSYDKVLIIRTDGGWHFAWVGFPDRKLPWSEENFIEVISELATKR